MITRLEILVPSFARMACAPMAFVMILLLSIPEQTSSGATVLHTGNLHEVIDNNELVFINFYADWCRFSQMLHPVFEEASNKVEQEITIPGKVVFAKVDCDSQPHISQQYKISKYPTIKLVRYGKTLKREYRGQRSAEALSNYIKDQLKDPIVEHKSESELAGIDKMKGVVIAYFRDRDSPAFKIYQKTASVLRDDCEFHSVLKTDGEYRVLYRPAMHREYNSVYPETDSSEQTYSGDLLNYEQFYTWVIAHCVPLVREITFANAEELTEEGIPFLILFYHPDHDADVVKRFHEAVAKQLSAEKNNINCLTADGTKFTHPLHHLGKALHDLPILAIDSFRHMYIFKKDTRKYIDAPNALINFYQDLQSGKLHREFHHGPDPDAPEEHKSEESNDGHVPKSTESDAGTPQKATTPPESAFAKLAPSNNRYTIIKDEL